MADKSLKSIKPGMSLDCGVASRASPGEKVCGDVHLIKAVHDNVLLAVVDGLGHGAEAAAASRMALDILDHLAGGPLNVIFRQCHDSLFRTRGVTMTVGWLEPEQARLTWMGVGNVEAVLLRAGRAPQIPVARPVLRSGIVGYQLPSLQPSVTSILPGDILAFASDGINPGFAEAMLTGEPPQRLAEQGLERYFKGSDDALLLVAKYLGSRRE